jgi:N-acetyl-gamma-glutamyl-phosphate reductase
MARGAAIGVVGASGYSGATLARLLAAHPKMRLAFCTSDSHVGERVAGHLGLHVEADLAFEPNAKATELASEVDVVVLATSAEVSATLAPGLLERGKTVVDLSGAFRLDDADAFARWYGFAHPAPALLGRAHYGLPEVFGAPTRFEGAPSLVANPGCYPTAAILALAPLLRAGLVEPTGIVVDAKSGVTGAGRKATEEHSFAELDEDLRAYKLLSHQHTPEIRGALEHASSQRIGLTFTAHLLPVRRGLLATCYARPRAGATSAVVEKCLADAYAGHVFIHLCPPDRVRLHKVVGTNHARIGVAADADVVVVVCAIDNLVKGAAGQAVQNLNLFFGYDEWLGLSQLQRIAP